MSEIIERCQQAQPILCEPSLAWWQRLEPAMQALNGLPISDLRPQDKQLVETEFVEFVRIFANYDIKTGADYEHVPESDVAAALACLMAVTDICLSGEEARVMTELASTRDKLPVAAIDDIRRHPDIFVPLLIESVTNANAEIRSGKEREWDDTPFFALYLLIELKVEAAYPVLLQSLYLPGPEGASELFSDAVGELAGVVMALASGGDTRQIDQLVLASEVNQYVRWAALDAYKLLLRDGVISRQHAIDGLHQLFQDCVDHDNHDMLAPIAIDLSHLAADSALETIRSAYQRDLVDDSIVSLESIEQEIAGGEAIVAKYLDSCRPTGVSDTIAELKRWASFQPTQDTQPKTTKPAHPAASQPKPASASTIRIDERIGRNSPCPCGSGKKFKKCCDSRTVNS